MQLFTDSELPICCLRITPNNESISIDEFNSFIYKRLMSSGEFYITTCRPRGEYYLRISINNYSTKESHVEALYCSILKVCEDADNKFTNCANI
jgi:L-2,4-diaminobutyrate decarboxylase